jgi:hypothetical protein
MERGPMQISHLDGCGHLSRGDGGFPSDTDGAFGHEALQIVRTEDPGVVGSPGFLNVIGYQVDVIAAGYARILGRGAFGW